MVRALVCAGITVLRREAVYEAGSASGDCCLERATSRAFRGAGAEGIKMASTDAPGGRSSRSDAAMCVCTGRGGQGAVRGA